MKRLNRFCIVKCCLEKMMKKCKKTDLSSQDIKSFMISLHLYVSLLKKCTKILMVMQVTNPLSISVEKLNVGIQMYKGVSNKVIYNPGLVKIIYDELNFAGIKTFEITFSGCDG